MDEGVIRKAAALVYEYKHGEPLGVRALSIGPDWDCWKVAVTVLALVEPAT